VLHPVSVFGQKKTTNANKKSIGVSRILANNKPHFEIFNDFASYCVIVRVALLMMR
jgi:hypothetical protein